MLATQGWLRETRRAQGQRGRDAHTATALECHMNRAAGDPGSGVTLRLTSPAPPLAGAMAVGEDGWFPLDR